MRHRRFHNTRATVSALTAAILIGGLCGLPSIAEARGGRKSLCKKNAQAGLRSCRAEIREEFWEKIGICVFDTELGAMKECFREARDRSEPRHECKQVYHARRDICTELPGAYDPSFEPEDFDSDFAALSNPNPYWPLGIGNEWIYRSEDETITIEVEQATKQIEGVTCITVHDRAEEEGFVVEATDDWHAMGKDGSVHYCGEISQNFELFEGDDPLVPELVDVDGSWKAGRDGAKPGILMQAFPEPGQLYRQEWAFGEAEDMGLVLSNSYGYGKGYGKGEDGKGEADNGEDLDDHVPEALADHFCAEQDCVVTKDFTPLEPGVAERKYYARGVGLFLEVDLEAGEFVPLTECNFHPLCDDIPELDELDEEDDE